MMQKVSATAKYVKLSPQKVKIVVDEIRKLSPEEAISVLAFVNKSASPILVKVIKSALANAQNNMGLMKESLKFKEILIGKGPMSKRYRPVSRGRAHQILKRTSHITVILEGEQKAEQKSEIAQVETKALETSKAAKVSNEENKNAK